MPLAADLCSKTHGLEGAIDLATAALRELRGMESSDRSIPGSPLTLRTVTPRGGSPVRLRPLNSELFISDPSDYLAAVSDLAHLVRDLRKSKGKVGDERLEQVRSQRLVSRGLYTTVQAIGAVMDVLLPPNKARKNFGTRFEEVVESLLSELGLGHAPLTFSLPYETASGRMTTFRNQVDLVISSAPPISSRKDFLDPDEVVVSMKTSSKDRFGKIFLDKEVLRKVTGQEIPVLALFHNDVQRSLRSDFSVTFVAGNFIAYVQTFGPLDGVYYIDPPPHIDREPWSRYLRTFEDLLLDDLWKIVFRRGG